MRFLILFLLALSAIPAFSQAPTVPGNPVATATSGTAVTLTWTASIGGAGITYRIFRNNAQVGTDQSGTTFSDTGLTPGQTYTYNVSASNSSGTSAQSVDATVTTPNTPATPTGLRAVAGTDGVVLNWNSVSGATEYVIFRNGTEIDTSTTNTYVDTDTEVSTTYRYSVASSNASGDSSKSAEVAVTTKGDGSQRTAVWTRAFEAVDGDFDGIVTFDEYLSGHPSSKLPEVVMLHRFNSSDDDDSGDLTVDEYIAHFGGKTVKRPSKAQTFTLADVFSEFGDGDGYLNMEEYALTLNRGTPEATVLKKFNKLDKDHTGFLSEAEFGIKYGDTEGAPEITSSLTATGEPGVPFSYQILATKDPTSYNATGLPAELTIDTATGVISGTVTTAGTYTVTISAKDGSGTGTATLAIKIGLPLISSAATASVGINTPFSYQIVATNSPASYSATGLPTNVTVNTITGLISGTPTVSGTFNVVLGATNAAGTGSKTLVLTVTPAAPSITSALAASGTTTAAFSYQIVASNTPTSFTATPLPAGLSVSAAGLITGTPTAAGVTNVSITATNAGGFDTKTLVITVTAPPSITSSLTAGGVANSPFSYQIAATNTPTSYSATGLPATLTLNTTTGLISGTPTAAGVINASITATNSAGADTKALVITITAP
jgi:hypothetical protein